MIIQGEEKHPLNELAHHGVLGMHWGRHKAPDVALPTHASYTKRMQSSDRRQFGKGSVQRINARLHAGQTRQKAQALELTRRRKQYTVAAAAIVGARILQIHGPTLLKAAKLGVEAANIGIATAAHANRMKAGATAVRAIASTASKVPYAKIVRGAYKITTL
jgi:hypothetical protein